MKILLTLCVVLLVVPTVFGVELGVILKDSIAVADTAAGSSRYDTLYTDVVRLTREIYWAQFYWGPIVKDTNFAADSLFCQLQYATTQNGPWVAFAGVTTILNGSADLDTLVNRASVIDRDSAFTGEYWRARFIYRDSNEATLQARVNNVYNKRFELRLSEVK